MASFEEVVIRQFSGGWNVVDNDLNLDSRYAKELTNMWRGLDGAVDVRYGTRLFTDIQKAEQPPNPGVYPTGLWYFGNRLVVTFSGGGIYLIDGSGVATNVRPDNSESSWGAHTFASAAQFKGRLIIVNGVDKPIEITEDYTCQFLSVNRDGTGGNIHVPTAKYVLTANRYLLMAGDLENPSMLHISDIDAPGVWYGDEFPGQATQIDLGSYLTNDDYTIYSLNFFRGKVLIGYRNSILVFTIGEVNEEVHDPVYTDTIDGHGSISHKGYQSLGDDALFVDLVGVPKLSTTVLDASLKPDRASQLIDPDIQANLNNLSLLAINERVFSVYNQRDGQYMLFVPNANTVPNTTATPCYVQTNVPSLKINAWSLFTGWNFCAATRSAQGRIFFADPQGKIWLYGAVDDPYYADFIGDTDVNADGTGIPIDFVWELPWADLNTRTNTKTFKYISFDTKGYSRFTCEVYIDNLYRDVNGDRKPALSMDFYGGDSPGYGGGTQPYGGGRRAVDERGTYWPAKFKIFKLRFYGSAKESLHFVSVALNYLRGSFRR